MITQARRSISSFLFSMLLAATALAGPAITVKFTSPSSVAATSLTIAGNLWSTATLTQTIPDGAATVTSTLLVSKDNGASWFPAPYAEQMSPITGSYQPVTSTLKTVGVTTIWKVALPGNTTNLSVNGTVGTYSVAPSMTLAGYQSYVAYTPVAATLYDATVGINDTGVLDLTGWRAVSWFYYATSTATNMFSALSVDDAGTSLASIISSTSSGQSSWGEGVFASAGQMLTKYARFTATSTAAVTRMRVEARR